MVAAVSATSRSNPQAEENVSRSNGATSKSSEALVKHVYILYSICEDTLFAFLAFIAIFAQFLNELKDKYGSAASETFTVRTGIGVRVRNGPNGAVAEMLIFPMRADSLIESRSMTFSYETAKNLFGGL